MKPVFPTPGSIFPQWALTVLLAVGLGGKAWADNHLMAGDGANVVIGGDVLSVAGQRFQLDYSGGIITVEMDDWDVFNEADMINPGETVTVRGTIDNSFFSERTVEANTVYVAERATRYHANDFDEEGDLTWISGPANPSLAAQGTWLGISGEVLATDGSEIVLDTGNSGLVETDTLTVDTAHLDYNPLDDRGYQHIGAGDRVFVSGTVDDRLFANYEIDAFSIISVE